MSISFLSVFSNVSVCSAHLIILFHPSSDLLTITTSRDRPFSPLVGNQTVVHLWRWSILCNFPLLQILGDGCMGRPPPQILGDRPLISPYRSSPMPTAYDL